MKENLKRSGQLCYNITKLIADFFNVVFMINRCLIISVLILTASFFSFFRHGYV